VWTPLPCSYTELRTSGYCALVLLTMLKSNQQPRRLAFARHLHKEKFTSGKCKLIYKKNARLRTHIWNRNYPNNIENKERKDTFVFLFCWSPPSSTCLPLSQSKQITQDHVTCPRSKFSKIHLCAPTVQYIHVVPCASPVLEVTIQPSSVNTVMSHKHRMWHNASRRLCFVCVGGGGGGGGEGMLMYYSAECSGS